MYTYLYVYLYLFREDLVLSLQDLKRKLQASEDQNMQLKAENQRQERIITKQQHHIDKILSIANNNNNINNFNGNDNTINRMQTDTHREAEKSQIVRQLKKQIIGLRDVNASKDAEIQYMQMSQAACEVMNVKIEKEEYFNETMRLKSVISFFQFVEYIYI